MAQKTQKEEYNDPSLLRVKRPLRNKGFYTLLLTALFGMFIFVTYYAVQQVQVYQSSARECPRGEHLNTKGKCVKNAGDGGGKTCPTGQHLNTKGTCVKNTGSGGGKECPTGQHLNTKGVCVLNVGDGGGTGTNPCVDAGGACRASANGCQTGEIADDSGLKCAGLYPEKKVCCVKGGLCADQVDEASCSTLKNCTWNNETQTCADSVDCSVLAAAECIKSEDCHWFVSGGFCGANCITYTDEASCTAGSCGWNSELQCCGGEPPCASGDGGGGGDGTGTVGAAVFDMSLSFQGITTAPLSGETTMDVLVTLAGGPDNVEVPTTGTFTVDGDGIWTGEVSFDNITSGGGYKLLVKGPKHMQKKVCDLTPTETSPGTYACGDGNITVSASGANTADFSGIRLLVGDLAPQDGIVDAYDVSLVRNNFCTTENPDICKDPKLLSEADLNLDGIIDSQDYSLMIASLSIKYDEK